MASFTSYVGNGSQRDYAAPPYIDKSHIASTLDGASTSAYTWLDASTIRFNTAPANGVAIRINRTTPAAALVDFSAGGILTDSDLDLFAQQGLYVAEEARDTAFLAPTYATEAANSATAADASADAAALSEAAAAASAAAAATFTPSLFLAKADNLSGIANTTTARSNLGLVIGTLEGNVITWAAGPQYPAGSGAAITGVNASQLNGKSQGNGANQIPSLNASGVMEGDDLPGGCSIQRSVTTSATYASTTAAIPLDDTIPQIGEGYQLFSVVITPKFSTSSIRILAEVHAVAAGGSSPCVFALFVNGGANAVKAVAAQSTSVTIPDPFMIEHSYIPGSTSAQTITLRVGPGNAGTLYINGNSSGRLFGGVLISRITVDEVRP